MTDTRQRTTIGNRFRFLARFLGLTGLLAVPAGWLLAAGALPTVSDWTGDALRAALDATLPLAEGSRGLLVQIGTIALLGGAAAILLWLVVELLSGLFLVTGRKTDVGTNAAVQIGTIALLGGAAAILLWLVVELLSGLFLVTGRKTAVGTNAAVQIGLAAA